jgi:hypothetical protein
MVMNRSRHLLDAVDDLVARESAPPVSLLRNAQGIFAKHFASYVKKLRVIKNAADDWYEGIVDTEAQRVENRREAERNVALRRPYGAVVHPIVIHCLRNAWLTCQGLNDEMPISSQVAPQSFVLSWLEQSGEAELFEFVATLPFWPIGQDESGRWV